MGNLEKNAQSTIPGSASTCRAVDFFMGSANAPRRALGRQNATFFARHAALVRRSCCKTAPYYRREYGKNRKKSHPQSLETPQLGFLWNFPGLSCHSRGPLRPAPCLRSTSDLGAAARGWVRCRSPNPLTPLAQPVTQARREQRPATQARPSQPQQQHQSEPHVSVSRNHASGAASSYRHRAGQRRAVPSLAASKRAASCPRAAKSDARSPPKTWLLM